MKSYVVHFIVNGHILSVYVLGDNVVSATAAALREERIDLDNLISVSETPFLKRVSGYLLARDSQGG